MNSDGYLFFTTTHRLYVQGVRRALRQRLESVFGENWWEQGVEYALQDNHRRNLRSVLEKNPDSEPHLFIEASHFGWIIVQRHNEAFADAFNDTIRTFKEIQYLTNLRNEWAHIHDISLARARQAADLMKGILASLRCEEALEIELMIQNLGIDPGDGNLEKPIDYWGRPEDGDDPKDSAMMPLDLWRQLQSYLVLEKSVQLPEEGSNDPATVTIRVHNTAPASSDWPAVYFNPVVVAVIGTDRSGRGDLSRRCALEPGQTHQMEFSFPVKQLVNIEFQVVGEIDPQRLLSFQRATSLPAEVIEPLRRDFVSQLAATGIKEYVNGVLAEIGALDANMPLGEVNRIRESVRGQSDLIKAKHTALSALMREFHLDRESTLGARVREIALALEEFGKKLGALDEAIGQTNLASIAEAVQNLKQIQLAVLRVEDTIRTMTRSE